MGRKKTYVGTQVARVIEDDKLPDSIRKGIATALFQNGEVVDHILEELVSNVGVRAERMYAFAEKGHYVHGLPSGEFKVPGDSVVPAIQTALQGIHGGPVTMKYGFYGPANTLHIGWMKLVSDYGYNPATNELAVLSASVGKTVYLHDMVVQVPYTMLPEVEVRSLDQWGAAACSGYTPARALITPEARAMIQPSPVEVVLGPTVEALRVVYTWVDDLGATQKDYVTFPVEGFDDEANYFHACYVFAGALYYWLYEQGLGSHTSLDELVDSTTVVAGEFFPFLYFRHGKTSEITDKTTESYRDAVKLAKYLNMDYDQVAEGVDANPDIADVEQAVLMFAVPANTENEQERAYLFEFFNRMFLAQGDHLRFQSEAAADTAMSQLVGSDIQPPGIVIQDARFKLSLTNQGIYKVQKKGTIAEVGEHASGFSTFNATYILIERNWDTNETVEHTVITPVTYHHYQRQLTHDLFEEIQVVELRTNFHINGQYSVTGDETDKILLIPLDHSITESMSIRARETLYARSLHFVFNSITTVKLKWYQTGIFKTILLIVAVIITIYTWGTDGGGAIGAALAAGAYTYAAQLILIAIIEMVMFRLAFKLFVKVVGVRAAFVIAIVAALAGGYMAMESGSLTGTPWAQDLLTMASGITNAVDAQMNADFADLANEASAFEQYVQEQTKLLETAQELLDGSLRLSPFVIFGENPQEFYDRTVHSGNIGIVGIEAVSAFVDSKLNLPRLSETLGQQPVLGE